jgi:hypothetical protein
VYRLRRKAERAEAIFSVRDLTYIFSATSITYHQTSLAPCFYIRVIFPHSLTRNNYFTEQPHHDAGEDKIPVLASVGLALLCVLLDTYSYYVRYVAIYFVRGKLVCCFWFCVGVRPRERKECEHGEAPRDLPVRHR